MGDKNQIVEVKLNRALVKFYFLLLFLEQCYFSQL